MTAVCDRPELSEWEPTTDVSLGLDVLVVEVVAGVDWMDIETVVNGGGKGVDVGAEEVGGVVGCVVVDVVDVCDGVWDIIAKVLEGAVKAVDVPDVVDVEGPAVSGALVAGTVGAPVGVNGSGWP